MSESAATGRRTPRTTFDIALYGLAQVAQGGIALLLMGAVARILGPDGFGQFSFLFVLASLLALVADFGLGPWITRAVAQEPWARDRALELVLLLRARLLMASLLLAAGVGIFFLQEWARFLDFLSIALYTTVLGFVVVFESFLMGLRRVGRLSFSTVLGRSFELAAVFAGMQLGLLHSVRDVGLAISGGAALRLALLLLLARPHLRPGATEAAAVTGTRRALGDVLREVAPFAAAAVLWTAYFRVDVLLLERLATPLALGLYTAGYRLIEALLMIPRTIVGVLFPVLSSAWSRSELTGDLLRRPVQAILVLALGSAAGVFALSEEIMSLLFGRPFAPGADALRVLAVCLVPIFLNLMLGSVYAASHRQGAWSVLLGAGLVVNVIANLLLIPRLGYPGAAWAKCITETSLLLVVTLGARRQFGPIVGIGWVVRLVLASAAMFWLVLRLEAALPIRIGVGVLAYALLLTLLRVIEPGEWRRMTGSLRSGVVEIRDGN